MNPQRPKFTHDNMAMEYEVLGHFAGESLPPGNYWVREIGSRWVGRKFIDADERVLAYRAPLWLRMLWPTLSGIVVRLAFLLPRKATKLP